MHASTYVCMHTVYLGGGGGGGEKQCLVSMLLDYRGQFVW